MKHNADTVAYPEEFVDEVANVVGDWETALRVMNLLVAHHHAVLPWLRQFDGWGVTHPTDEDLGIG